MNSELTESQRTELQELLRGSLADLSSEIADTDNPSFRNGLRDRREVLESVLSQLDGSA